MGAIVDSVCNEEYLCSLKSFTLRSVLEFNWPVRLYLKLLVGTKRTLRSGVVNSTSGAVR